MAMASDSSNLEYLGSYTVPTSWEDDTNGNATNIYNTAVLPLIGDDLYQIIVVTTDNNNASRYKFIKMCLITSSTAQYGSVLRTTNISSEYSLRSVGQNTSAWCSAGTELKVYRVNI